jgi:hypothetical protein
MSDTDNTPDDGLTTEQIAAGAGMGQENVTASASRPGFDDADAPLVEGHAASERVDRDIPRADGDSGAADPGARVSLLDDDELESITARWKDIQADFIDEPAKAVQEADALVAELMQRLAEMFTTERAGLEKSWARGNQVSTEDLRQGLRRYRSFFERLLAA